MYNDVPFRWRWCFEIYVERAYLLTSWRELNPYRYVCVLKFSRNRDKTQDFCLENMCMQSQKYENKHKGFKSYAPWHMFCEANSRGSIVIPLFSRFLHIHIKKSLCLKCLPQFSSQPNETCYTKSPCRVDVHDKCWSLCRVMTLF